MDEDFDDLGKIFEATAHEAKDDQLHRLAQHSVSIANKGARPWLGWFVLAGTCALALFVGLASVGQNVGDPIDGPISARLDAGGFDEVLEEFNDEELDEMVAYLDMGLGDDFSDVDVLHGTLEEDFEPQWIED